MKWLESFASRRRILIIGGGIAVIAVIVFGVRELSGRTPSGATTPAAVPVTAALARRENVPNLINTIGTVQSIDAISVQSQVSGPIVKIEFTPGQEVKKGQEIFLIDPRPYQAALDQAQAQLAHDQAVLAEAELDLTRYQTLAEQNSIAKQQAQDQVYVVEQDKGTVQVDQANVFTAQINLQYCHITSPIDGRAGVLLVELGNLVGPGTTAQTTGATTTTITPTTATATAAGQTASGSGLVSIAQMKPIYVSFPVPQTMFDQVKENQAAAPLEVDAFSQSGKLIEKGTLTVIDNQVNVTTGTVMLQATFANADEVLWPGEFVRVQLIVSMRHNAVTVPAQSVMEGPDGSYVYVIAPDATVHRVTVQVAARQNDIAVIASGLSGGEKVVTDGQYRLANGVKVDVQQGPQPTEAVSQK
jgi:membrane fusion protein, multidrug efflux system